MIRNTNTTLVKMRMGDAFKNYERKKEEKLAVVGVEPEARTQNHQSH